MLSLVIVLIILFGFAYDKFKFWNEQIIVMAERNPYSYSGKMTPKETIIWSVLAEPTEENRGRLKALIATNLMDPNVRAHRDKLLEAIDECAFSEGENPIPCLSRDSNPPEKNVNKEYSRVDCQ